MAICVGVDVSKGRLDWATNQSEKVETLPNTRAGARRLAARLRDVAPEMVVVESTGGYERALTIALSEAGLPVALVNPWRVRRFAEGVGILAKTDPLDARLLALFGERARPVIRALPGPREREMADLVQRRRQLVAMIVAEKSRLETASRAVRGDIQSLVRVLERRVAKLDTRIDAAIEADAEMTSTFERLQTAPRVGPGIARTLVAGHVKRPPCGHRT